MDHPQKPKPTSDGKQTAGHSYSTRSQDKQTSLCDDDSSGSQAHQPPLKRKTRQREKQAGKSVGNISDDATPDSNPVDTNTVDEENTHAQTALTNDLVLESLFKNMNWSDLLSCRVVNKKWQYEATTELRRRKLVIRLSFHYCSYQKGRYMLFENICRRLSECRTPSLLSSFQVKTVVSNELGSTGVRNIFTTVGNQLKYLKLHLDYSDKASSFAKSCSLMKDLQNLLCSQAPNLEFVEIKFDFPSHWEDEVKALNSSDQPQNGKNEFLMLLPKLKTFIVNGLPPAKFVEDVINAAVNLTFMGGTWSACSKYLMGAEGKNKIHLFKSLQLAAPSRFRLDELDLKRMEIFLTEHKQDLKLETVEGVTIFTDRSAPLAPRIVAVMNQILEASAGSLQKLRIEPSKWWNDLLIIPRLPKLQEICFDCFRRSWSGFGYGVFFPHGFNMNHSFPNVSSIVFMRCHAYLIRFFFNNLRFEIAEPAPGIRYIIVLTDREERGDIDPSLPTLTDFRHVFPNLVSISYAECESVYSDKYYKI